MRRNDEVKGRRGLFTSESVSAGHPDKVCDRTSDAIVDLCFRQASGDEAKQVRAAVESLVTKGCLVLAGEAREPEALQGRLKEAGEEAVRAAVREIGYEREDFHWRDMEVMWLVRGQSKDIAYKVDEGGAGDQGLMFGYACDETKELSPAPLTYAHEILKGLDEKRGRGEASGLGVDAKAQVTVRYEGGELLGVETIVVSCQHEEGMTTGDVEELVRPVVVGVMEEAGASWGGELLTNPSGIFVEGGPAADAGLTGRKIIVDTYGGAAPHGGGAFSGKDPSKVDRSGAYAARYVAKNVVASGLARRCTLQVAYAIGKAEPVSLCVDLHGTGEASEEAVEKWISERVDLTPNGIRETLGLWKPIYERTTSYGHFGRAAQGDGGFSWERTDMARELKRAF